MSLELTAKKNGGMKWALYGGAGFIGQHLALSVLNRSPLDQVYLLDIKTPAEISWKVPLEGFIGSGRLHVHTCDVRDYESLRQHLAGFGVMVNLAAVHREPGHKPAEYFDTNVPGARNICRLAEEAGCGEIIFTSSISVYGIHDRPVDEHSTVQPQTPYGQSKLQAEIIHRDWARRTGGRLCVLRPGVVFGPGEEGNVTRLMREMLKRKRVICIHPDRAKAGIYIEELVALLHWLRKQTPADGGSLLVNAVSNEGLTINAYGRCLQQIRDLQRSRLTISGRLIGLSAALMKPLQSWLPPGSKIHPQRLRKLISANDIRPAELIRMVYPFSWSLERALADWLDQGL